MIDLRIFRTTRTEIDAYDGPYQRFAEVLQVRFAEDGRWGEWCDVPVITDSALLAKPPALPAKQPAT